jgi:hypothetical protein
VLKGQLRTAQRRSQARTIAVLVVIGVVYVLSQINKSDETPPPADTSAVSNSAADDKRPLVQAENEPSPAKERAAPGTEQVIQQEDPFSIIRTKCAKQWPTDFDMRAYCERKQREALQTLSRGKPDDIDQGEFTTVRAKCAKQWSTDFDMRTYCERKQYDAIRELRTTRR